MPLSDGRSPLAIGIERASRISMVGVAFVLPILAGHWFDRAMGSKPLGLLVGVALGSFIGFGQLVRAARSPSDIQRKP